LAVDVGSKELGVVGMGHDLGLDDGGVKVLMIMRMITTRVLLLRGRRQEERSSWGHDHEMMREAFTIPLQA